MQDWEALKYFLTNLGLLNLALVALALGVGVMLGRVVWARSAQGLVQLRERMSVEVDRTKEAEDEAEVERERYRELREQLESSEGGPLVINSPELEEEVAVLRERTLEADGTLEQMLMANQALEEVVKDLEGQNAELLGGGTTGVEHDAAELAGLRAEIEVMREESKELRGERDEISAKVREFEGALEKAEAVGEELKAKRGKGGETSERVAALEMQLLEAKQERKQVEDASAILRKELYGMRRRLEEIEKRESLEKELDDALRDAEQRLTRLQAEVTKGAVEKRSEEREEPGARNPEPGVGSREEEEQIGGTPEDLKPKIVAADLVLAEGEAEVESEEEEVVRLEVVDEDEDDFEAEAEPKPAPAAEPEPEAEELKAATEDDEGEDDLTLMKGVGAVLAQRMNAAGVTSFLQIAEWSAEDQKVMSKKLMLRNRMKTGDWRGQARALHEKFHGEDA